MHPLVSVKRKTRLDAPAPPPTVTLIGEAAIVPPSSLSRMVTLLLLQSHHAIKRCLAQPYSESVSGAWRMPQFRK